MDKQREMQRTKTGEYMGVEQPMRGCSTRKLVKGGTTEVFMRFSSDDATAVAAYPTSLSGAPALG